MRGVLNVRGRLVHAKAARLAASELAQLFTAQRMLGRVMSTRSFKFYTH